MPGCPAPSCAPAFQRASWKPAGSSPSSRFATRRPVTSEDGALAGVVSDGDFKRILMAHPDPWGLTAADVMSRHPSTIGRESLVAAAVRQMEERPQGPITALVVVDDARRPIGVLHLHDCLRAGSAPPESP